tara:strand:- start:212 stop:706 length:495 start_codon:yes stop_codon:yes gene_type:complete
MILQYLFKKENKEKKIAISYYKNILEITKNFINNKDYFITTKFQLSFEIVSLFLIFYIHLLKENNNRPSKLINDYLIQEFILDLDESLRKLGIGDMSIGKHVKSYVKKFYFRLSKFDMLIKNDNKNAMYKYLSFFQIINKNELDHGSDEILVIYSSISKLILKN